MRKFDFQFALCLLPTTHYKYKYTCCRLKRLAFAIDYRFSKHTATSQTSYSRMFSQDDPYSVFGDNKDEQDTKTKIVRDPSNGALVFREGTENAMLLFVRQMIDENQSSSELLETNLQPNSTDRATIERVERIVRSIDNFCYERHWMMHVGPDKATVLTKALEQCYVSRQEDDSTFVVVEIGTYCGYSLLNMANCLLRLQQEMSKNGQIKSDKNFHIITVDVNPSVQNIARQLTSMAGLSNYVTFLLLSSLPGTSTELSKIVQEALSSKPINSKTGSIDFLFLDHNKGMYLSDLRQLEKSKLVRKGTHVAADNVFFHKINNYRQYLSLRATENVVKTNFIQGTLEYILPSDYPDMIDSTFVDGIGRLHLLAREQSLPLNWFFCVTYFDHI